LAGKSETSSSRRSKTSSQLVLSPQFVEPALIKRARQFIESNYRENVSLTATAHHVGMSTYYLCKQFKRTTGVSFTRYVSGIRVAQAKHLLRNPKHRVSEVAFQVGCQSLSHFNRIFKGITGYSPTEFRRRLQCN
jgi:AraC-like DNA-binding protein